jgi:hypothetical protein
MDAIKRAILDFIANECDKECPSMSYLPEQHDPIGFGTKLHEAIEKARRETLSHTQSWIWVIDLLKHHGICADRVDGLFDIVQAVSQRDEYRDRLQISPFGDDKIDELESALGWARHDRNCLVQALRDAVNSPKGVVPDSAYPYLTNIPSPEVLDNMRPKLINHAVAHIVPDYVLQSCCSKDMEPALSPEGCTACEHLERCNYLKQFGITHG